MIEAEQSIVIQSPIDEVWDYVKDIEKWAKLFPGCQACEVISADDSRWTIKVGAGGMLKTVNVLVNVERWDGPGKVDFSFSLEKEPVIGRGAYKARKVSAGETEISMGVQVQGSGSMAPMWEAVSRPLLPQLAKSFASSLKTEIEGEAVAAPGLMEKIAAWFKKLWRAIFGSRVGQLRRTQGDFTMSEQNKAVVTKFIEAMGAGDAAVAATCLAPDAITVAKGFGNFSGVREYDTIIETIKAFTQLFPEGLKPRIETVTAEGERVAVEFEGGGKTVEGKDYYNQYCMVFSMSDGKIKQVNEYFCNKLADDVLWPLVSGMADETPS